MMTMGKSHLAGFMDLAVYLRKSVYALYCVVLFEVGGR